MFVSQRVHNWSHLNFIVKLVQNECVQKDCFRMNKSLMQRVQCHDIITRHAKGTQHLLSFFLLGFRWNQSFQPRQQHSFYTQFEQALWISLRDILPFCKFAWPFLISCKGELFVAVYCVHVDISPIECLRCRSLSN